MTSKNITPAIKVIAIDGPAGSGKSTIAGKVAAMLSWKYVNTGALYRTLALLMRERKLTVHSETKTIQKLVDEMEANYRQDSSASIITMQGRDISEAIRTPAISEAASIIAKEPFVRKALLPIQRSVVIGFDGAVVDGRDMGTVVFPDAPLKIFLTASVVERARRRKAEIEAKGQTIDLTELEAEIAERDERDATRSISPMRPADDSITLDSTQLSIEDVVQSILNLANSRGFAPRAD